MGPFLAAALAWGPPQDLAAQAPADVVATHAPAATAGSPPPFEAGLRALLAGRLGVPAARVALEVGRMPTGRTPDPEVPPSLKGSGTGGTYLVELTDVEGERYGVQIKAGIRWRQPVAARPLSRGHRLDAQDIAWQEAVHYGAGAPHTPALQGWEVARSVREGEALAPPLVRPAAVVHSGQPVLVIWSGPRVRLAVDGTALSNGAPGDNVTARLETGRRVRGVAQPDGTIVLEGGTR